MAVNDGFTPACLSRNYHMFSIIILFDKDRLKLFVMSMKLFAFLAPFPIIVVLHLLYPILHTVFSFLGQSKPKGPRVKRLERVDVWIPLEPPSPLILV